MKPSPYGKTLALLTTVRRNFDSYDIEDITEDDYASVIVDTISSNQGGKPADALLRLGGDPDAYADEFADEAEDFNDWEFAWETVEDYADKVAETINADLPEGEEGEFNFEWRDGAFVLVYAVPVE